MYAKFVRDVQRDGIKRNRKLYMLMEPYEYKDTHDPSNPRYRDAYYILASATEPPTSPEVTVLPCDERGTPLSTDPLPGSIKGTRSHEDAMKKLGCKIVPTDQPFPYTASPNTLTLIPPDFSQCALYNKNDAILQFQDDEGRVYTIPGVAHPDGYVIIFSKEYPIRRRIPEASLETNLTTATPPPITPASTAPLPQLPVDVPQSPPDIICDQRDGEFAIEATQDRIFKDILESFPDTQISKEFE